LFQISDSIVVISGSGAGAMNLTINNEANYAFTDISIAKTNPSLGDLVNYAPFTYGGVAVTATNRLPIGEHSSGLYEFSSGGAIGSTYTFTVTATMTNGQAMTEKTNIEAG
jgi:hypothetical protein